MKGKEVVILLAVLLALAGSASGVFLGTIEGYVYFLNGTLAGSGASVNATVASCSGSGCNGTTTTDANSYYVIANLNLDANGTVTATGGKNNHQGQNTTTANSFQAATANITLCQAPSAPSLSAAPDNHDRNRTLSWTSGVDSSGFPTYDVFKFETNASIINATSPQNVSNLSMGNSFTWRVSTCNTGNGTGCCSANVTDTFNVTNTAPGTPTLTNEDHTDGPTVTFEWSSGSDADGDDKRDEFQLSNTSDFSNVINSSTNATSPYSVTPLANTTGFFWRVRTCDVFNSCSPYASDVFVVYNCSNETVVTVTQTVTSGGGGGGSCLPQNEDACKLGDQGCRGLGKRFVCGNFDGDPYLELGEALCDFGYVCVSGACAKECVEEWTCTEWSPCEEPGTQRRSCVELNGCNHNLLEPDERRMCVPGLGEAPLLIGVPPFTISAPQVLTTPVVPVAAGMLALLLAILTLSLLFDKQLDALLLFSQIRKEQTLIRARKFAQADVFNTRVVDPHIRRASLDEKKPFHRKLLRQYYEANRDIARYHEELARKVGEKTKASFFAQRAEEYAKLALKYTRR